MTKQDLSPRLALAVALVAAMLAALSASAMPGRAASEAAPGNTAAPTIAGTARVGQTLTASNGTWSNAPTDYAYLWLRCNGTGAACTAVANGAQKTYTLVPGDAAHTMRIRVTASNAEGSAAAQSEPTAAGEASNAVPKNTDRPIVSGTPAVGKVLAVDKGTWTGSPTGYTYRWQRCDADNIVSCGDIPGAPLAAYKLRTGDLGYRLRAQVTARSAAGSAIAYSATTAVIRPALRITNHAPSIAILNIRRFGATVYARFRVCDDSFKNLTILQTDSRPGKPSYSRKFATLTAPRPCAVYTRHWTLVPRFRGAGHTMLTLRARDKSGFTSRPAHGNV